MPGAGKPSRAGRRSMALKVGIAAAMVAAVAILAGTAGLAVNASRRVRSPASRTAVSQACHQQVARRPLRVVTVRPSDGTARLSGVATVQSASPPPVAHAPAYPRLSPNVLWPVTGVGQHVDVRAGYPARAVDEFTLRIPAGQAGVTSAAGSPLAKPVTTHFKTAAYAQLRLAELLSNLGYLPLSWQPGAGGACQVIRPETGPRASRSWPIARRLDRSPGRPGIRPRCGVSGGPIGRTRWSAAR